MSTTGSSNAVTRILDAAVFAADKHKTCRRKDVDATPYINHPLRVAQILTESKVTDLDVIVAALLHDTIEDTEATYAELLELFGPAVADLVAEVTDDKTKQPEERKALQVQNAPKKSDGAKLIKLADKAANLEDLVARPPTWSSERIEEYRRWATRVATGCRGVNDTLDRRVAALCSVVEERDSGGRI
jgi:guanosine-3',5'-bis(diphosphate) 3'-pyrophosphohydrolase